MGSSQQISTPRRVLRTEAAATYVGLSPSTLEKRRLTGGGPRFIRLGARAVGYEIQALDEWLRECASAGQDGEG